VRAAQPQAFSTGARDPARNGSAGPDRTAGFRGPCKNPAAGQFFRKSFGNAFGPWREFKDGTLQRRRSCRTHCKRTTSSKIRCATSPLLIFRSARSRPSQEKETSQYWYRDEPRASAVTSLATIQVGILRVKVFFEHLGGRGLSLPTKPPRFSGLFLAPRQMSVVGPRELVSARRPFKFFPMRFHRA